MLHVGPRAEKGPAISPCRSLARRAAEAGIRRVTRGSSRERVKGDPGGACPPEDYPILEGEVLEGTEFQTWAKGADFPRDPRGRCGRAPRPSARGTVHAPPQAEGSRGECEFNAGLMYVRLHSVEARHT